MNISNLVRVAASSLSYLTKSAPTIASTASLSWLSRAVLSSPADGKLKLTNAAGTSGLVLDGSVADALTLRNLADNASAPLTVSELFVGLPKVLSGAGAPEGAVTAPVGSLYLRTDGGTNTAQYRKESGAGNTGWVATSSTVLADPDVIYGSQLTLNASTIVGNTAGTIGDAAGVAIVNAVPAKLPVIQMAFVEYTRDTASYGGGGNNGIYWYDATMGSALASAQLSGSNTFGNGGSVKCIVPPTSVQWTGLTALNAPSLVYRATTPFTNPGTAAGTARVSVSFRLLSLPA